MWKVPEDFRGLSIHEGESLHYLSGIALPHEENGARGKVRRLLGTGAGLIFKGSGFYITDYRSEGYKQAAKKEGGGAADSGKPRKRSPPKKGS